MARNTETRRLLSKITWILLVLASICGVFTAHAQQCPKLPIQEAIADPTLAEPIGQPVERLLAWQLPALADVQALVLPPSSNSVSVQRTSDTRNWVWGAMMIGMVQWAQASNNASLWQWLQATSAPEQYMLGDRLYHADDHAVGQVYSALHSERNVPYATALGPTQESFDAILADVPDVSLDFSIKGTAADKDEGYSTLCLKRWCWCDALFMAPPTWLALAQAANDPKYLDFSEAEFWAVHEYLYRPLPQLAPTAGLFLRDSRYFEEILDDQGRLIFWGRGNGWVYAGLTAIIDLLPPSHPTLDRYVELFTNMTAALVEVQRPSTDPIAGFWGPSLLAHDLFPFPEASCTGFFVAGVAWGVRRGILDAQTHVPVARSGWQALLSAQRADGAIGYVQQIGSEPGEVEETSTQLYGTGAFLAAAANMLQMEACLNSSSSASSAFGTPLPGNASVGPAPATGAPAATPAAAPGVVQTPPVDTAPDTDMADANGTAAVPGGGELVAVEALGQQPQEADRSGDGVLPSASTSAAGAQGWMLAGTAALAYAFRPL